MFFFQKKKVVFALLLLGGSEWGGFVTARVLKDKSSSSSSSSSVDFTDQPTRRPTNKPTDKPPTKRPTSRPTTRRPTGNPTASPTKRTSSNPTGSPTRRPTGAPIATATMEPTPEPTEQPSATPSETPTLAPTSNPTSSPTRRPTAAPTETPTMAPTPEPTEQPSATPSETPTMAPTAEPTKQPSVQPTEQPSDRPSMEPSEEERICKFDTDCRSGETCNSDAYGNVLDYLDDDFFTKFPDLSTSSDDDLFNGPRTFDDSTGICVPGTQCESTLQCEGAAICDPVMNTCTRDWPSCSTSCDCGNHEACLPIGGGFNNRNQFCVPSPTCTQADDCAYALKWSSNFDNYFYAEARTECSADSRCDFCAEYECGGIVEYSIKEKNAEFFDDICNSVFDGPPEKRRKLSKGQKLREGRKLSKGRKLGGRGRGYYGGRGGRGRGYYGGGRGYYSTPVPLNCNRGQTCSVNNKRTLRADKKRQSSKNIDQRMRRLDDDGGGSSFDDDDNPFFIDDDGFTELFGELYGGVCEEFPDCETTADCFGVFEGDIGTINKLKAYFRGAGPEALPQNLVCDRNTFKCALPSQECVRDCDCGVGEYCHFRYGYGVCKSMSFGNMLSGTCDSRDDCAKPTTFPPICEDPNLIPSNRRRKLGCRKLGDIPFNPNPNPPSDDEFYYIPSFYDYEPFWQNGGTNFDCVNNVCSTCPDGSCFDDNECEKGSVCDSEFSGEFGCGELPPLNTCVDAATCNDTTDCADYGTRFRPALCRDGYCRRDLVDRSTSCNQGPCDCQTGEVCMDAIAIGFSNDGPCGKGGCGEGPNYFCFPAEECSSNLGCLEDGYAREDVSGFEVVYGYAKEPQCGNGLCNTCYEPTQSPTQSPQVLNRY